jgi:hypothetical protein
LIKCLESKEDFFMALQVLHATPKGNNLSPSQMLMSRRIKSTLPIHDQLMQAPFDQVVQEKQLEDREKQRLLFK